jgi:hypothetical protein
MCPWNSELFLVIQLSIYIIPFSLHLSHKNFNSSLFFWVSLWILNISQNIEYHTSIFSLNFLLICKVEGTRPTMSNVSQLDNRWFKNTASFFKVHNLLFNHFSLFAITWSKMKAPLAFYLWHNYCSFQWFLFVTEWVPLQGFRWLQSHHWGLGMWLSDRALPSMYKGHKRS